MYNRSIQSSRATTHNRAEARLRATQPITNQQSSTSSANVELRMELVGRFPELESYARAYTTTYNPIDGIPPTNPIHNAVVFSIIGLTQPAISNVLRTSSFADSTPIFNLGTVQLANLDLVVLKEQPSVMAYPFPATEAGKQMFAARGRFDNWVNSKPLYPTKIKDVTGNTQYVMGITTQRVETTSVIQLKAGFVANILNTLVNGDDEKNEKKGNIDGLHNINMLRLLVKSARNFMAYEPRNSLSKYEEQQLDAEMRTAILTRDSPEGDLAQKFALLRNITHPVDWIASILRIGKDSPELMERSMMSSIIEIMIMSFLTGNQITPNSYLRCVIERSLRNCPNIAGVGRFTDANELMNYAIQVVGPVIANSLKYHIMLYELMVLIMSDKDNGQALKQIRAFREQITPIKSIATLINLMVKNCYVDDNMIADIFLQTKSSKDPNHVVIPGKFLTESFTPSFAASIVANNNERFAQMEEESAAHIAYLDRMIEEKNCADDARAAAASNIEMNQNSLDIDKVCDDAWELFKKSHDKRYSLIEGMRRHIAALVSTNRYEDCNHFIRGVDRANIPGGKMTYRRMHTTAMLALNRSGKMSAETITALNGVEYNARNVTIGVKNVNAVHSIGAVAHVRDVEHKKNHVAAIDDEPAEFKNELVVLSLADAINSSNHVLATVVAIVNAPVDQHDCFICMDNEFPLLKCHNHPSMICTNCRDEVIKRTNLCPLCNLSKWWTSIPSS